MPRDAATKYLERLSTPELNKLYSEEPEFQEDIIQIIAERNLPTEN